MAEDSFAGLALLGATFVSVAAGILVGFTVTVLGWRMADPGSNAAAADDEAPAKNPTQTVR